MKSIITKSIEGGYVLQGGYILNGVNYATSEQLLSAQHAKNTAEIVVDPLFWQALGKARGWMVYDRTNWKKDDIAQLLQDHYVSYAIDFHRINLTEGWDKAVAWLESLVVTT